MSVFLLPTLRLCYTWVLSGSEHMAAKRKIHASVGNLTAIVPPVSCRYTDCVSLDRKNLFSCNRRTICCLRRLQKMLKSNNRMWSAIASHTGSGSLRKCHFKSNDDWYFHRCSWWVLSVTLCLVLDGDDTVISSLEGYVDDLSHSAADNLLPLGSIKKTEWIFISYFKSLQYSVHEQNNGVSHYVISILISSHLRQKLSSALCSQHPHSINRLSSDQPGLPRQ
jgi:hypothetical protein